MKINLKNKLPNYKKNLSKAKKLSKEPLFKASANLILSLVLIIFLALLAIKPVLITITKLYRQIQQAQEINQQMRRKVAALKQLRSTYPQIEQNIKLVDKCLPKDVSFPIFAKKINYFIFTNNLELQSHNFGQFNILSSAIKRDRGKVVFKITLAGSFKNVKNFIKDIENMDRIIKINSLSLSSKSDIPGKEIKALIEGEVYWLPQSAVDKN